MGNCLGLYLSTLIFQLHVMDSQKRVKEALIKEALSTPCNGFYERAMELRSITGLLLSTPCNGFLKE